MEETGFVVSVCGDCDIVARIEVKGDDDFRRFLAKRIRRIKGIERAEAKIILNDVKDEGRGG